MKKQRVDYTENLSLAMKLLEEVSLDGDVLYNELSRVDQEREDILHIIENLNFNASQGCALAKKIQEVQRERREIKNKIAQLGKLQGVINAYNKGMKTTIEKSLSNIKELESKQNTSRYHLRHRKDLEGFNKLSEKQRGLGQ